MGETGRRHGFGPDEAVRLIGASEQPRTGRPVEDRIEARLTEQHAVFQARDLHAVALEQTAGEMGPEEALAVAWEMVRDRRVLTLEGGRMTTLAVRAQEQAIERRAELLAVPAGRDVGEHARAGAVREVSECIGGPLSVEQNHALRVLTGRERAAVLVGPAGTGKGVVIDAAARAEQHAGRETIGIAVSGSTAERLGADTPGLAGRTLTLDSLVARAKAGTVEIGRATTVFLDEAGMVDHKRMDALTELIERSGAKLIAVGDGKQLPSIGPGGMFDRLATHTATAELSDIRRTQDPDERRAWAALRAGEPERAMAHYFKRAQLHFSNSRDEAGEAAIQRWMALVEKHGIRKVALIADASNKEIDRLNARAQRLRAERDELGHREVPLGHTRYGLREGDIVVFTSQHRPAGQPRVENGSRGQLTRVDEHGGLTVELDGSGRSVRLPGEDVDSLRLCYAQHVYRQQGATVERTVVVTGGWQTSKESAYVEATRARKGTDWFLAREELGAQGQDADRVMQLARRMGTSRAQTPSLAYEPYDPAFGRGYDLGPLRILRVPTILMRSSRNHDRDNSTVDRGR
jgi:ATP-dependent exoDNAse (exonuclease V) alpha subunit